MIKRKRIAVLGLALFAFGIGTSMSITAAPMTCQSCYTNYNNCVRTGGDDCGAIFAACFSRACA